MIKEFTNVGLLPRLVGSNHQFWFQLVNTEPELGLIVRTSWFWNRNWAILKTQPGTGFLLLFTCGLRTNTRISFQNIYRTKSKQELQWQLSAQSDVDYLEGSELANWNWIFFLMKNQTQMAGSIYVWNWNHSNLVFRTRGSS